MVAGLCIPGLPGLLKGKERDAETPSSEASGAWQLSSLGRACPPRGHCGLICNKKLRGYLLCPHCDSVPCQAMLGIRKAVAWNSGILKWSPRAMLYLMRRTNSGYRTLEVRAQECTRGVEAEMQKDPPSVYACVPGACCDWTLVLGSNGNSGWLQRILRRMDAQMK